NNPKILKVFHNAIFDMRIFPLIYDIDESNIFCTLVASRLLGYQETGLAMLTNDILDTIIRTSDELLSEYGKKNMLELPSDEVAAMCCSHAKSTLLLYDKFKDKMDKEYMSVEMKSIPILNDMSQRGMKVNERDRAKLEEKLTSEVTYYRSLCEAEDFNPASPMQVGYILAKRGNFLPLTRGRKQYRTDNETLAFLDDPIASIVLSFRQVNKLLTTYIIPLRDKDRIYTKYNLDARVGRVSSSAMNLQNIPGPDKNRKLLPEGTRYIFQPDTGVFTTGDYSQEHMRILYHFSQDREMKRVFEEGEYEGSIHKKTAADMNIPYKLAKVINYAIPYGADAHTVSIQARIKDEKRCARFLDKWFETYPDAADWIRGAKEEGLRDGWALPTLFGRRIRVPEEFNRWGRLDTSAMGRKCINYPTLGSDGEIMKRALIICEREKLPLAVTVHDSISCDGDIEFPVDELENITPFKLPFEVKKTLRWE
ncbi:hypothetical protein LCGC14_1519400, partial [marine sediment metagenome]